MEEELQKSTHTKLTLWQPIVKSGDKYVAILSDDDLDRDDEVIGKSAFDKILESDDYTAILINHKNDALMQIGEWTNKRVEKIGDRYAFVAEPKFYLSNPNAQIIKGCMDEGAQYGVSIGAIPKQSEFINKGNKKVKMYTDIELLEASIVAIPANKHAMALAVSKMWNKHEEDVKMSEELNKEFEDLKLQKENLEKEKEEVSKKIEELESSVKKGAEEKEEISKQLEAVKTQNEELSKKIEELKNTPVLKGNMQTDESVNGAKKEIMKEGSIPIFRK